MHISSKEDLVFLCHLCSGTKRFKDLRQYVREFLGLGYEFSDQDRHLFAIGFRESISELRNAWRAISSSENKDVNATIVESSQIRIADEIQNTCSEASSFIVEKIEPTCTVPEQRVYFTKLLGDFARYRTEVQSGPMREETASQALRHYTRAADVAICHLSSCDPVRLGLMLNFSLFYYEIINDPERACIIAKAACDDAVEGNLFFKEPTEGMKASNDEARHIYSLIRANLINWSSQLVPRASTVHVDTKNSLTT